MNRIDRLVVDHGDGQADVVGDDRGCFFHNGQRRVLGAHLKLCGDFLNCIAGFLLIADVRDAQHNHRIRRSGCRSAKCGGRPLARGADGQSITAGCDHAVTPCPDGFREKAANQSLAFVYRHSGGLQKRHTIGKHGYVRGGAADVQSDRVFLHVCGG